MIQFERKTRYIICGVWNTIFGYLFGLIVYTKFLDKINFFLVSIVVNVACITMSYFTYKIFVFNTKGNWYREYLKAYLVYGFNAIIGTFGLWLLYEKLAIPIWISQAILILSLAVFTYLMHLKFTFYQKKI